MSKKVIKIIRYQTFSLFQVFILQIYAFLISNFLRMFLQFETNKNLDLGMILGLTQIFLKSRFVCIDYNAIFWIYSLFFA